MHGREYFFGGGIQSEHPDRVVAMTGMRPVERRALGSTRVTAHALDAHLSTHAMRSRFAPERYDLFTHNCNHFSNDIALFLLGQGIPSEIVDLPQRVAATPLGSQIMSMWGGFAGAAGMGGGGGSGADPFAGHFGGGRGGGGGDGGGSLSGAVVASSAELSRAASRALSAPAPVVVAPAFAPSKILSTRPLPMTLYEDVAGVPLCVARLKKISDALVSSSVGSGGAPTLTATAAALSESELALLDSLPSTIQGSSASGGVGACFNSFAARLLREWAPSVPDAAFPAALLVRLLASRTGGASLSSDGGALDALLDGSSKAGGWGVPAADNQALQALANAFAQGPNAVWARSRAAALAAIVARDIAAARADIRSIAAALAANLSISIATEEGGGGVVDVSDNAVVTLLAATLGDGLTTERDADVLARRLIAGGVLVARSQGAAALAQDLALIDNVRTVCDDVTRPEKSRALALEVVHAAIKGGQ